MNAKTPTRAGGFYKANSEVEMWYSDFSVHAINRSYKILYLSIENLQELLSLHISSSIVPALTAADTAFRA